MSGWNPLSYTVEGLSKWLHKIDRRVTDLERGGQWNYDHELNGDDVRLAASSAHLLVLSATNDPIASGGDYVTFGAILDQYNFAGAMPASSSWTHPVSGVYSLTYEHAWDALTSGGTVELEIDGAITPQNRLAEGATGTKGRGTIHYYAEAGSTGRIKVTQSSGSPETCDATLWVAITDRVVVAANTVELYVGGDQVAFSTDELEAVNYSTATVFVGELAGTVPAVSDFYFDDVSMVVDGAELLSNAGFESAIAGTGTDRSVTTGNWRAYQLGSAVVARSTDTAVTGTQSGRVDINSTGASQAGYFFQDVSATEGAGFDFSAWVYPTGGTQVCSVLFDWNRSTTAAHDCSISVSPTATTVTAFGATVTGDALPQNEWSHVRVVVASQELI